jgi:phosphoribosyl 1,2-cyclic phosphodiesterase
LTKSFAGSIGFEAPSPAELFTEEVRPLKLTFLGTRGEIGIRSRLHYMHTSLEVSYLGRRVMIDCGADWVSRVEELAPDAIVLTHGHPDHAWGLKNGAPCTVYASEATWSALGTIPVDRATVQPRSPLKIHGITFEAFLVEHSIRAPAVGYRVIAGRSAIFYVPDVVYIYEVQEALQGIQIYVGDGASVRRPLVRKRGQSLVGHAAVRTQLGWCRRAGVTRVLITHCGTEIVSADPDAMNKIVHDLAQEQNIGAQIATDGMKVVLP